MAFPAPTRHLLLLVSTMVCIFAFNCKTGRAHTDPHLGAAGVVANEIVPRAESEGETNNEYYPRPDDVITKALECFNDKYIYSSCDEAYRLTQHGELNVPHEYTDEYCSGACLKETHLVLHCINGIFKHFEFYNKATVEDVQVTIKEGCSYGPKRGDFNVEEHIQDDEGIASKKSTFSVFYALVLMMMMMSLF